MATRNLSAKQPAKNIGASPPSRKTNRADGTVVTEKLSPIPFNQKMVDPAGNVVLVNLATGYTIRGFRNNDYGVQTLENKLKAGFLPYNECPFARGHLRPSKGVTPCEGDTNKAGVFKRDTCCEHIEEVIANRRAATDKKSAAFARKTRNGLDKMMDTILQLAEENKAHAQAAAESATEKVSPSKRSIPK